MDVGGSKKGGKSDINVTPLIDIVLVLLIIFMVMTPSMLKELTANVPKKAPENMPPPPANNTIVIEYTEKREIAINQEPIAWEALADKIADHLKQSSDKVVFFKIEDKANYGEVVKLMDTARGAGAKTLGIVTKE
jgi:biopolymer transport protein ExbD